MGTDNRLAGEWEGEKEAEKGERYEGCHKRERGNSGGGDNMPPKSLQVLAYFIVNKCICIITNHIIKGFKF